MDQNNTYRYELKIQALSESIAKSTAEFQNLVADLRVEVTMKDQEIVSLRKALEESVSEKEEDPDSK